MAASDTDKRAKHRRIEEDLLAEIVSGKLVAGDRVTAGGELCTVYGVSRPTAERAITALADKGYLERVQGRGTFVCNWQDAAQPSNLANSLAVILTDFREERIGFNFDCIGLASIEAEEQGYHLLVSTMENSKKPATPRAILNNQVVGSLVLGRVSAQQLDAIDASGVPAIFLGNYSVDEIGLRPCIRMDFDQAGCDVTRALIELNRGPVWLMTQQTTYVHYCQELLAGYQRAMFDYANASHCHNMFIGRSNCYEPEIFRDADFYQHVIHEMELSQQDHFPMIVSYRYVLPFLEHLEAAGIGMDRITLVAVGRHNKSWPNADRIIPCPYATEMIASAGVEQIVAAHKSGVPLKGRTLKTRIIKMDDPIKPFKVTWV